MQANGTYHIDVRLGASLVVLRRFDAVQHQKPAETKPSHENETREHAREDQTTNTSHMARLENPAQLSSPSSSSSSCQPPPLLPLPPSLATQKRGERVATHLQGEAVVEKHLRHLLEALAHTPARPEVALAAPPLAAGGAGAGAATTVRSRSRGRCGRRRWCRRPAAPVPVAGAPAVTESPDPEPVPCLWQKVRASVVRRRGIGREEEGDLLLQGCMCSKRKQVGYL